MISTGHNQYLLGILLGIALLVGTVMFISVASASPLPLDFNPTHTSLPPKGTHAPPAHDYNITGFRDLWLARLSNLSASTGLSFSPSSSGSFVGLSLTPLSKPGGSNTGKGLTSFSSCLASTSGMNLTDRVDARIACYKAKFSG